MAEQRNSVCVKLTIWFVYEGSSFDNFQYILGAYSRSIIAKAMNEYHMKTCVRFVARDARRHRDYVYIHPDDGCYSLGTLSVTLHNLLT